MAESHGNVECRPGLILNSSHANSVEAETSQRNSRWRIRTPDGVEAFKYEGPRLRTRRACATGALSVGAVRCKRPGFGFVWFFFAEPAGRRAFLPDIWCSMGSRTPGETVHFSELTLGRAVVRHSIRTRGLDRSLMSVPGPILGQADAR